MNQIELKTEGRRVYIVGNTFPLKAAIKDAGGHWDADQKLWWVGAGKRATIEAAIASAAEAPKEEGSYDGEVKGKVRYKDRTYFVICASGNGESVKLTPLDGKMTFWAKMEFVEIVKRYEARSPRSFYGRSNNRAEYPKLSGIRKFIEEKKDIEKGGECPTCARNFASGRWAPYYGSGDYDDCPQCGTTHREM